MFTAEIKVNGVLVAHIYGRNITDNHRATLSLYEAQIIEVGENKVSKFHVEHNRADGLTKLIEAILSEHHRSASGQPLQADVRPPTTT